MCSSDLGAGGLFLAAPRRVTARLCSVGMALLIGFVLLRWLNGYGDPAPWQVRKDAGQTVMSFLNVSKYPPSLLYVMATLGTSLLIAPAVGALCGWGGRMLHDFGRTPFFTYLLHIYLAHGLAVVVSLAMGMPPGIHANYLGDPSRLIAAGWGVSLGWVYVVWAGVVLALWPLAHWFAGIKRRRQSWWLSYI